MEDKDIFRTALFGGYQKEDVTDYIRSLENENEAIRILANKEKSDLKVQLEKEKAASDGLKASLEALHDKISRLEKEQPNSETHSPATAETEPEAGILTEEWTHRLDEERKAFLEDRRLWADNLAQRQADMHKLWQNELQQFQRTLETIQGQLERSARDAAAANKFQQTQEVSSEPDHGTADVLQDALAHEQLEEAPVYEISESSDSADESMTFSASSEESPAAFSSTEEPPASSSSTEEPPAASSSAENEQPPSSLAEQQKPEYLSEADGSEKPSSSSGLNEEQIHEYVLKTSSSINQTQKRVSELLLKLDHF